MYSISHLITKQIMTLAIYHRKFPGFLFEIVTTKKKSYIAKHSEMYQVDISLDKINLLDNLNFIVFYYTNGI